jgi:hypothetical protein
MFIGQNDLVGHLVTRPATPSKLADFGRLNGVLGNYPIKRCPGGQCVRGPRTRPCSRQLSAICTRYRHSAALPHFSGALGSPGIDRRIPPRGSRYEVRQCVACTAIVERQAADAPMQEEEQEEA